MYCLIMRNRNRRWILFWFLVPILQLATSENTNNTYNNNSDQENENKNVQRLFSPRMDYDQWKPLGRGDPLKNDPTYDYVPPVLDRVLYWKPDPPSAGDNPKTEILLLGVTSKKPAKSPSQADSRLDNFDSHVNVKFISNPNQRIAKPSFIPSVTASFFPSFLPTKNKYPMRTPFSNEQRVPYTILMPPPMTMGVPQNLGQLVTQSPVGYTTPPATTLFKSSTPSVVTVQPSNLIYQSSSLIGSTDWTNKHVTVDSSVAWEQHLPSTQQPLSSDFRDSLVYNTNLAPPDSYIHIEFAPHNLSNSTLVTAESQTINYVTPPPLLHSEEIMFKGQVADDSLDISNTYVKIVKPEAEVHSTGIGLDEMLMFPHVMKVEDARLPPLSMQTLQEMQTMHPPPVTQSPVYTKSTTDMEMTRSKSTTVMMMPPPTTDSPKNKAAMPEYTPTVAVLDTTLSTTTKPISEAVTATIEATDVQTTVGSLTTDPLFRHYKQPKEPIKGPLYLIIQGHSKVKTYGPSKQHHGINIQETNEIPDNDDGYFPVKHLHGFHMDKLTEPRMARSGNLQTLKHVVQTGYGAIDLSDSQDVIEKHNFQEAEVQGAYEVVDGDKFVEKYHKGTVEEARKMKV